jgi:hypothetical protein
MIRKSLKSDIPWMVSLSHNKRKSYAEAQKQFWKMAKDSDKIQTKWFEELFEKKNAIALVADNKEGFVIGKVVTPPEVYDAGLTLMIDDFCVSDESLWSSTGKDLIDEIKKLAKTQMVSQILVVCGAHDSHKKSLLKQVGLATASEWYVGGL